MNDKTMKQRIPGDRLGLTPVPGGLALVIPDQGIRILRLDQGPLVLGSGEAADVRLQAPGISRRHCLLRGQGDRVVVQDLDSTNGTRGPDGWLRPRSELRPPCLLELGRTRLALFPLLGRLEQTPVLSFGDLVVSSPAMAFACVQGLAAANSDLPVLIQGESGTGKELMARAIHGASRRRTGPLVPVNCANLRPQLAEAQLFGVKKGAFTGAVADQPGLMFSCRGGTLFLDEISELPLPVQAGLLRAIEQQEARPLGGVTVRPTEFRLVAATNMPLAEMVAAGSFRQDLYFRLNVLQVNIPPLRERREDIGVLALVLARSIPGLELSLEATAMMARHPWPGNVRELRNLLLRLSSRLSGPLTGEDVLPELAPPGLVPLAPLPSRDRLASMSTRQLLELLGIPKSTYYYRRKKAEAGEEPGQTLLSEQATP